MQIKLTGQSSWTSITNLFKFPLYSFDAIQKKCFKSIVNNGFNLRKILIQPKVKQKKKKEITQQFQK